MTRDRCWMGRILAVLGMIGWVSGVTPCWADTEGGTDAKGDGRERVDVKVGRSLPWQGGIQGAPCYSATVGVRLGDISRTTTVTACHTTGGSGGSVRVPIWSGAKAELFTGSSLSSGQSGIGIAGCQTGDVATLAHWPLMRTVLWDPNTGCSFFDNSDGCAPFADQYSLKPGRSPAFVYLFDWGRLRPEPDADLELLEKPYLKLPTPTPDTIFLYRTTLPFSENDCRNWPKARGDVLLTRLRPDKFTRPGYTPPPDSQTSSPPIGVRASDMNPWDEQIMDATMPAFYEPLDLTFTPALGNNVTDDPNNQFVAHLVLNPFNEPRRAPYTIIGQAFGFPLVIGKVHTMHADICVWDGDTCLAKPEGTDMPTYIFPFPLLDVVGQPPDTIELSATWWEPLTVEEQGAQSGDTTGKDIPYPKGLLSSLTDSDQLEQLRTRVIWTLTKPSNRPNLLEKEATTIESDPFNRVVPHARLNTAEPGIYEVELAVQGDDGDRLVVDKIQFWVYKVKFVKMWDTHNKANQIYNPTLKDDPNKPFPVPRNKLYLVEAPDDSHYHVTLEVDDTPKELRSKLMYAIFKDDAKLEGSDGFFPANGPANIVFDHQGAGSMGLHPTDFTMRVGYDVNENALLDSSEAVNFSLIHYQITEQTLNDLKSAGLPDEVLERLQQMKDYGFQWEHEFLDALELYLGIQNTSMYKSMIISRATLNQNSPSEPIVRGTNAEDYPWASTIINQVVEGRPDWICDFPLDILPGDIEHAPYLVRIFRDGNPDHYDIYAAEHPTITEVTSFNCFDRWDTPTGTFSEWLTHNSGLPFNEQGTAEIAYYTWKKDKPLATFIANSPQMKNAVKAIPDSVLDEIKTYFADKPVWHEAVLPRDDPNAPFPFYQISHKSESPFWVPETTIMFDNPWEPNYICDDLVVAIARGRLLLHEAQYTVQKVQVTADPQATTLVFKSIRHRGIMEDLYDYNRDGGVAPGAAATLQIGHGNGGYGETRRFGVVYRLRVEFDQEIQLLQGD